MKTKEKIFWISVFISLLIESPSLAQRFSTGAVLYTSAYFNTELPSNYICSPNSYLIYYSGNEKRGDRPSYGQAFNILAGGLTFNLDYKRMTLGIEAVGGVRNIKVPVVYPIPLLENIGESTTIPFKVINRFTSLGLVSTTRLNSQNNGPFFQLGMAVSFNSFFERLGNYYVAAVTNFSDNELLNTIYTERFIQYQLITGFGFKLNNSFLSLRNNTRILGKPADYPLARFFELNVVFTQMITFQKLKKGYHLYLEL